jgi:AbiU2
MASRKKLGKLKPVQELAESAWLRELEHIDSQLTHVLDVFNFLDELLLLGNESKAALGVFNTAPLFWTVFRDCLQESLFMGLGRLCDNSPDVVNVRRVLAGAMAHSEFFSAEALRRRVAERELGDDFLAGAWVPDDGADLRFLREAVSRHLNRVEQIYAPIRDCHYGHRLTGIDTHAMFEKTNKMELGETLDVLRQLVTGLRFFYDNGVKPRVDVRGRKALDMQCRACFRDVVSVLAGNEL